jgi:hypothetical protein
MKEQISRFQRKIPQREAVIIAAMLFFGVSGARAQSSPQPEFLPEIDSYIKLNSDIRFVFQAKDTREGGSANHANKNIVFQFTDWEDGRLGECNLEEWSHASSKVTDSLGEQAARQLSKASYA